MQASNPNENSTTALKNPNLPAPFGPSALLQSPSASLVTSSRSLQQENKGFYYYIRIAYVSMQIIML